MAKASPCLGCDHEKNDKRLLPCKTCPRPSQYDKSYGSRFESVPVDVVKNKREKQMNAQPNSDKLKEIHFKTCTGPCGQEKELNDENFGRHYKTKDGYFNICRDCKSINHKEVWRRRNEKMKEALEKDLKKPTKPSESKDGNVLTINFSENIDVLAKIRGIAHEELRTPENQILYWLKNSNFEKLHATTEL